MTQQQCQTEGDPHSLLSPLSDALKMSCPTVDAFKLSLLLKEVKFTFQIYRARINREQFFHWIDGIIEYYHLSASNASC